MANAASSHGSPPCATSQRSSRSVLPGRGRGMGEESTTATGEKPEGSQVREPMAASASDAEGGQETVLVAEQEDSYRDGLAFECGC